MMMMLRHEFEDGTVQTLTVPVPDHKEVAIGTLGDIIRRSQLPRNLFEA
jgi:predicted RNA binding protein YcfA (HicA-like mRNA interferase family)